MGFLLETIKQAGQRRQEILESGEGDFVLPPWLVAIIFKISVAKLKEMSENNQSLTITPVSGEKVIISKRGFEGSPNSYRDLFFAVQMAIAGRKEAFDNLSPELESWPMLEKFRLEFNKGGEMVDVEEMQDFLQAYWRTIKRANRRELENQNLHPSAVKNSSGIGED